MLNLKEILLKPYNLSSTLIENIFFQKKKVKINELLEKGFIKSKVLKANLEKNYFIEIKKSNNFLSKYEVKKNLIPDLIKSIFVQTNLKDYITSLTGFNYHINFFIAYRTAHIPEDLKNEQIYANTWHKDKPFSKNTLKVIIPLEKIDLENGPMEILDINQSKKFNHKEIINKYLFVGKKNDIFLFLPNLCLHRAGSPEHAKSREQIMFQLNPAKKWSYSEYLFDRQLNLEPKFPMFDLKDRRILI
jgi:hypothetical protein